MYDLHATSRLRKLAASARYSRLRWLLVQQSGQQYSHHTPDSFRFFFSAVPAPTCAPFAKPGRLTQSVKSKRTTSKGTTKRSYRHRQGNLVRQVPYSWAGCSSLSVFHVATILFASLLPSSCPAYSRPISGGLSHPPCCLYHRLRVWLARA